MYCSPRATRLVVCRFSAAGRLSIAPAGNAREKGASPLSDHQVAPVPRLRAAVHATVRRHAWTRAAVLTAAAPLLTLCIVAGACAPNGLRPDYTCLTHLPALPYLCACFALPLPSAACSGGCALFLFCLLTTHACLPASTTSMEELALQPHCLLYAPAFLPFLLL
jgi:hypothetical protein